MGTSARFWAGMLVALVLIVSMVASTCDFEKCMIKKNHTLKCPNAGCSAIPINLESGLQYMFLPGNQISQIPEIPYEKLIHLDLSGNDIVDFKELAFSKCTELITLKLSDNRIRNITSSHFHGLNKLVYLFLDRNEITRLESGAFPFGLLSSLNSLHLQQNKIDTIEIEAFADLHSLSELDLSDNLIETLKPDDFEGLMGLMTLNLANNELSVINNDTFFDCARLMDLNLDGNQIHHIDINAFAGADLLKKISLNRNRLSSLRPRIFDIVGLEDLYLKENDFRRISPGMLDSCTARKISIEKNDRLIRVENYAFSNVPHLETIYLSKNKRLVQIEEHAFQSSNWTIDSADFSSNKLETISENLLPWKDLEIVDLSNNPWNCDCQLEWMKEHYLKVAHKNQVKCASPEMLQDRAIVDIDYRQFCDPAYQTQEQQTDTVTPTEILIGCSIVAGCVLVTIIIIVVWRKWNRCSSIKQQTKNLNSIYRKLDQDESVSITEAPNIEIDEKMKLTDPMPEEV